MLKSQTFTSSGTFTPQPGVTAGWVTLIGGGSGGGENSTGTHGGTGGGGSSAEIVERVLCPFSGPVVVTIGAGGFGADTPHGVSNLTGGDTMFGSLVAKGGRAPITTEGTSGRGGGVNGGTLGSMNPSSFANGPGLGNRGKMESPHHFGGADGANACNGLSAIAVTAGCGGGYQGPSALTGDGTNAPGAGGASTAFGLGGNGGAANGVGYGSGGGGSGGGSVLRGGNGKGGVCIVVWSE